MMALSPRHGINLEGNGSDSITMDGTQHETCQDPETQANLRHAVESESGTAEESRSPECLIAQKDSSRRRSSKIHNHFEEPNQSQKRLCKVCRSGYSISTTTSILWRHLKTHGIVENEPDPATASKKQSCIAPFLGSKVRPIPRRELDRIHGMVEKLFVAKNLSLSLVDTPEFQAFVTALNPAYVLPGRTKLREDILGMCNVKVIRQELA